MPEKILHISPEVIPQELFEQHLDENQEKLTVVPDGTGLQVLFAINGEYYVLAGVRSDSVLSVNGGTVEQKGMPFSVQLTEELDEETFGGKKCNFLK